MLSKLGFKKHKKPAEERLRNIIALDGKPMGPKDIQTVHNAYTGYDPSPATREVDSRSWGYGNLDTV